MRAGAQTGESRQREASRRPRGHCARIAFKGALSLGLMNGAALGAAQEQAQREAARDAPTVTLFLAGDVMIGRGIDQIMKRSVDPQLHEPYAKSATRYVELAESASGPIPRSAKPAYVWGDAREVLRKESPDFRFINLETALTTSDEAWEGKAIHYRAHPKNVSALRAAGIDLCSLANNHTLDWGRRGLAETLAALDSARIQPVGAGEGLAEAVAPAVREIEGGGRLLFFACGLRSSGIPSAWAAGAEQPGLHLLEESASDDSSELVARIQANARPEDTIVVSIHWGGNWGYGVPWSHRKLARELIDAGVDVVHGHSSHHPLGIEVYRGRLILYGCGDLINDYEGIAGHEEYRPDLASMYFPKLDARDGSLLQLRIAPMQRRRFQLKRASDADAEWLAKTLSREGEPLGTRVSRAGDGALELQWERGPTP